MSRRRTGLALAAGLLGAAGCARIFGFDPVSPPPVCDPATSEEIAAISAGATHTCAILKRNGHVRCWGDNRRGQLGIPPSTTPANDGTAADVVLSGKAVGIFAGAFYTCALLDSGRIHCWGDNGSGQLGIGAAVAQAMPGDAEDLDLETAVASIAVTNTTNAVNPSSNTCALRKDGVAFCWGSNLAGSLGREVNGMQGTPGMVLLHGDASAIATSAQRSCALGGFGPDAGVAIECWGEGDLLGIGLDAGQTRGDSTNDLIPQSLPPIDFGGQAVPATHNVSPALALGLSETCSVLEDTGDIKCWGNVSETISHPSDRTIGDESGELANAAPLALGLAPGKDQPAGIVAAGGIACVRTQGGRVKCWGTAAGEAPLPAVPAFVDLGTDALGATLNVKELTAGSWVEGDTSNLVYHPHVCALLTDNTVKCWGDNTFGELGIGSTEPAVAPGDDLPRICLPQQ